MSLRCSAPRILHSTVGSHRTTTLFGRAQTYCRHWLLILNRIRSLTGTNHMLMWWRLRLSEVDIDIIYRDDIKNRSADKMSRLKNDGDFLTFSNRDFSIVSVRVSACWRGIEPYFKEIVLLFSNNQTWIFGQRYLHVNIQESIICKHCYWNALLSQQTFSCCATDCSSGRRRTI